MKTALRAAAENKGRDFVREAMLPSAGVNADALEEAAAQDVQAVIAALSADGFEDGAEAAQKSMRDFEKWSDNKLMDYVRAAQYNTFGFEPLLAFLFGKKTEIQAVRIVLYGLLNRVPKEILKERLRDMYV
jgi:V/A-type H+-transporting ATPase subunit C